MEQTTTTPARTFKMKSLLAITAAMLAYQITPADCFSQVKSHNLKSKSKTSLKFQTQTEHAAAFVTNELSATSSLYNLDPSTPTSLQSTKLKGLPVWLSIDNSHHKEENIKLLRDFMRSSFFTENETLKLMKAIEEASGGDAHKAAGAAEFCLLLAETMEMGLSALTAGAFHYCSCVTAREHALNSKTNNQILYRLNSNTITHHHNINNYGPHVVEIAADAARLKQLEMVAGAVFAQSEHAGRVTPDHIDAENLRHLLLTETKDWRALAIRTAACLYRLKGILKAEQPELTREAGRTAREALSIYGPLASRMGMQRLKNELEGSAFRILYKRQYEAVTSLQTRPNSSGDNKDLASAMQRVLEKVKLDMTTMLENDVEFQKQVDNFSVTARVKEPYSMWKKMLRLGYRHVLQVPDALALRIVFDAKKLSPDEPTEVTQARERALCYYAQKLCIGQWKPMTGDPRFKDYIAEPKRNGYQSLHYTAATNFENEDWTLEVQVRSSEMHSVAEFGLASHWDYKAQKKSADGSTVSIENEGQDIDRSPDAYVRNVQEWRWQQHGSKMETPFDKWDATPASFEPVVMADIWQSRARADRIRARTDRLKPYLKALTTAQSDLARDHVFVFLTQQPGTGNNCAIAAEGKVLALPAGACVLDALRETERTLGVPLLRDDGFALNGDKASITRQLQNGDILGIQARAAATPVMA